MWKGRSWMRGMSGERQMGWKRMVGRGDGGKGIKKRGMRNGDSGKIARRVWD